MGQMPGRSLLAGLLAAAVAACGPALAPAGQEDPPVREPAGTSMNSSLDSVTAAVFEDAAHRTGIDLASLEVEATTAVTWADGSLGCPRPGMNYTMALVPGYRIKLRAGEQVLDYHASRRGYFVLCPAGRSVEPVDSQTE